MSRHVAAALALVVLVQVRTGETAGAQTCAHLNGAASPTSHQRARPPLALQPRPVCAPRCRARGRGERGEDWRRGRASARARAVASDARASRAQGLALNGRFWPSRGFCRTGCGFCRTGCRKRGVVAPHGGDARTHKPTHDTQTLRVRAQGLNGRFGLHAVFLPDPNPTPDPLPSAVPRRLRIAALWQQGELETAGPPPRGGGVCGGRGQPLPLTDGRRASAAGGGSHACWRAACRTRCGVADPAP